MSTALLRTDAAAGVVQRHETVDVVELQELGRLLATSGYFADAREMAQAAVKVMAGRELGVPPVASMMGINIIKGKVAMGAHLIASRVRAHGYDFKVTRLDNTGCNLEFLSKIGAVLGQSSFTEDDAKAAQCFTDMYRKYPRNMYYSRAVSNGAKWFCPEVFAGAPVYTPEELGAEVDENGEVIHPPETRKKLVEQRLREIKEKPAASATNPESAKDNPNTAFHPSDADIPAELGGTWTDPNPGASERRLEESRARAAEPVKVTPDDFQKVRAEFLRFGTGGVAEYDRIVQAHGAEPGKQYPSKMSQARKAIESLRSCLEDLQRMNQAEPDNDAKEPA